MFNWTTATDPERARALNAEGAKLHAALTAAAPPGSSMYQPEEQRIAHGPQGDQLYTDETYFATLPIAQALADLLSGTVEARPAGGDFLSASQPVPEPQVYIPPVCLYVRTGDRLSNAGRLAFFAMSGDYARFAGELGQDVQAVGQYVQLKDVIVPPAPSNDFVPPIGRSIGSVIQSPGMDSHPDNAEVNGADGSKWVKLPKSIPWLPNYWIRTA